MSRYNNKIPIINNSEKYDKVFEDRGISFIKQFTTPELTHAHWSQVASLKHTHHTWKLGDKLYKLSAKYYGDEKLWWIIAWYNKTPTESHIKAGQILKVPQPITDVVRILRMN